MAAGRLALNDLNRFGTFFGVTLELRGICDDGNTVNLLRDKENPNTASCEAKPTHQRGCRRQWDGSHSPFVDGHQALSRNRFSMCQMKEAILSA